MFGATALFSKIPSPTLSGLSTRALASQHAEHGPNIRRLGPIARKLQHLKQDNHRVLQNKLRQNLSAEHAATIERLIEPLIHDSTELNDTPSMIEDFVQSNLHRPELISTTLKYLNSQLMILSGAERHARVEQFSVDDGLKDGLTTLFEKSGRNTQRFSQQLAKAKVSPVFTAHPTHFNRPEASKALLDKLSMIDTPALHAQLCDEVWAHQGVRELKPSVQDEARLFANYVRNLHQSSRQIHQKLQAQASLLPGKPKLENALIEAGNWVGGDRDGNPFIDAKVLTEVVKTMSTAAFDYYQSRLNSHHANDELAAFLRTNGRESDLQDCLGKLARTRAHLLGESALPIEGDLYQSASEFVDDLEQMARNSLPARSKSSELPTVIQSELDLLRLDAQAIGFHGASTDIRQNSAMNEKTVGELLLKAKVHTNYENLGEEDRQAILTSVLMNDTPIRRSDLIFEKPSANLDFEREIDLISNYKIIHDTYGPKALPNCITANTETLSDMLEVMVLLKFAGLADDNTLKMNVIPLIETVDDLHNAPKILTGMLEHPWYNQILTNSAKPQQVMVGYSDSNKLDGPLASSWAVYQGTAKMLDIAKAHGLDLLVFHGRGGTEARGSGDSYSQEIRSGNPAALMQGFRQTEQGEEVPAKFGTPEISTSNLSDMLASTLATMHEKSDPMLSRHGHLMDQLATEARAHYNALYKHPQLPTFFEHSTPIGFVGHSNAGSRPASRASTSGEGLKLEKLRAIPWVGSWYQAGMVTPAFYGTGTALQNHGNITELMKLYQEWPFFKSFIDRTAAALDKADMNTAEQYAKLAPAHSQTVFDAIRKEYALTDQMIRSIQGSPAGNDNLSEVSQSMSVKGPLLKAAQSMQASLMKAHRQAGPHVQERLINPIVMSMQAISSANRFG